MMNWKCPFHQIKDEQRKPQIDWKKCHYTGDAGNYPRIMHGNDIIAKEQNISAIHILRTLANIHQDQNYQRLGWFHIPFLKSCRSKWTLSIDCTGIGKISWAEKPRIKNKLCVALEIVQEYITDFKVHGGLSTSPAWSPPIQSRGVFLYVSGIMLPMSFSILFSSIITLPKI